MAVGTSVHVETRLQLRHRNGAYLSPQGLQADVDSAGVVAFIQPTGVGDIELIDAVGAVLKTHHDDGDLFGIVDSHSHIFANYGFGQGFMARRSIGLVLLMLPDCELLTDPTVNGICGAILPMAVTLTSLSFSAAWQRVKHLGLTTEPTVIRASQIGQVVRFERRTRPNIIVGLNAWLGGLQLVVQHAVANQVICDLQVSIHPQKDQYQCNNVVVSSRVFSKPMRWNVT